MPTKSSDGLDVSAEEERYLRRTFRRFALPYLILLLAFVWWMSAGSGEAGVAPESVATLEAQGAELRAQVAELQASLAAVSQEVTQADARAAEAVARAEDLGSKQGRVSSREVAALKRELKKSAARIASLEKQLGDQSVAQRFDALRDRIAGVEEKVSTRSQPAAPDPTSADEASRP